MRRLLVAGGAAVTLLASLLAGASPASAVSFEELVPPPAEKIEIDLVAMAGSGCRPGTADVAISPDNTAFTVIYSDYLAQAGPGVPVTEGRKNCQLNVLVEVPSGYTFAIAKVDYRGYAALQRGATATQGAKYYFQGMSQGSMQTYRIPAPKDGDWINTDQVPVASYVWHPCGALRNLNINTELKVSAGSSRTVSYATMDSTDGSIQTLFHLGWKRCH